MKLTNAQLEMLWGGDGPYSQVNLIVQNRILDDKISRTFLVVEVDINPTTYRIIKQNINQFQDDEIIQQLITHADYRGRKFGYVSAAYEQEYREETDMQEARFAVAYSQKTIIKMHKFVIKNYL